MTNILFYFILFYFITSCVHRKDMLFVKFNTIQIEAFFTHSHYQNVTWYSACCRYFKADYGNKKAFLSDFKIE